MQFILESSLDSPTNMFLACYSLYGNLVLNDLLNNIFYSNNNIPQYGSNLAPQARGQSDNRFYQKLQLVLNIVSVANYKCTSHLLPSYFTIYATNKRSINFQARFHGLQKNLGNAFQYKRDSPPMSGTVLYFESKYLNDVITLDFELNMKWQLSIVVFICSRESKAAD